MGSELERVKEQLQKSEDWRNRYELLANDRDGQLKLSYKEINKLRGALQAIIDTADGFSTTPMDLKAIAKEALNDRH